MAKAREGSSVGVFHPQVTMPAPLRVESRLSTSNPPARAPSPPPGGPRAFHGPSRPWGRPHDSPPGPSRLCWTTKPRAVTSRHGYRRGSCHFAFGVLVDADLVVEGSDRGGGRKKDAEERGENSQYSETSMRKKRKRSTLVDKSRHEVDSGRQQSTSSTKAEAEAEKN